MENDIRNPNDGITIFYICPHCRQLSGIIISEKPFEAGHDQHQLFCCEHCGEFTEVWLLPRKMASKIRRLIAEGLP